MTTRTRKTRTFRHAERRPRSAAAAIADQVTGGTMAEEPKGKGKGKDKGKGKGKGKGKKDK